MLLTVVLLVLGVLAAGAGVPLILKLVPPNEVYGIHTERALSREEIWYEVNRFAGWALVIAAACAVAALVIWSNTLLRPTWRQFTVFIVPLCIAAGATLWYERRVGELHRARAKRRA